MIPRELKESVIKYLKQYPVVTLTGPRQAGKTTLVASSLPDYQYLSLEEPDHREYALEDPRGFLANCARKVILDEVQQAPELFSYIQTLVDKDPTPGRFVLTGSQQFLLNAKIAQTLAGRAARLRLLPLSMSELMQRPFQRLWREGVISQSDHPPHSLYYYLYHGFYPRVHQQNLDPHQFYRDYVNTYVTRDLQQILHVGDLHQFQNFLRLLAGRTGQNVNLTSLGNDLGVSHTTIQRWISVLEASYIIVLLRPFYKNLSKRIVKAPKIYFLDPGLLCYLLRVHSAQDLPFHPQIGGVFESFVITELYKSFQHHDEEPPLYFWQEPSKREIDCLVDLGTRICPVEIKSSQTINTRFFDNIDYWFTLQEKSQDHGALVYGGDAWQTRRNTQVIPWFGVS